MEGKKEEIGVEEKLSWEERIATFEPCEAEWAKAKSKSKGYPRDWAEFKDWLSDRIPRYFPELKEELEIKGSDILRIRAQDMQLHRDNPDRWRFERIALAYYKSLYKDKDTRAGQTITNSSASDHSSVTIEWRLFPPRSIVSLPRHIPP